MANLGLAPIGDEFTVLDTPTSVATAVYTPATAALNTGNYVVVWLQQDVSGSGLPAKIMGQIVDAAGNQIGSDFRISNTDTGFRGIPGVTALSDGGFVVSWGELIAVSPALSNLVAQRFDAAGHEVGGEVQLNDVPVQGLAWSQVDQLVDGRIVAAWGGQVPGPSAPVLPIFAPVMARLFDSTLAPLAAPDVVGMQSLTNNTFTRAIALAGGGFVVAWDSGPGGVDGDLGAVMGRVYDNAGVALAGEFVINTQTAGNQGNISIAPMREGGFVAAWTTSDPAQDGAGTAIKGQVFTSGGTPVRGEFLVNTEAGFSQIVPNVLALPDHRFMVTWATLQNPSGLVYGEISAQLFDADGSPMGGETILNNLTAGSQFFPSATLLTNNDIAVAWTTQDIVSGRPIGVVESRIFHLGPVNTPPEITSGGGGDEAFYTLPENSVAAAALTATDAEGHTLAWSISGGADAGRFAIDEASGALSFVTPADWEARNDADRNGIYEVAVTVSDGFGGSDSQALHFAIANVIEGAVIEGTARNDRVDATRTVSGQPLPTALEDQIHGYDGDDRLSGLGGGDWIHGDAGRDRIDGGAGRDLLFGGSDADTFIYNAPSDSVVGTGDSILDFSQAEGDRISFAAMDANTVRNGQQGFSFIGTGAFSHTPGELRYSVVSGNTFVAGDVDGDGAPDFGIHLLGAIVMTAGDFIL